MSSPTRHYIRTTDGQFLRYLSSKINIPFKETHKCCFTNKFLGDLRNSVSNGISFNLFQAMYMENQLASTMEKREEFQRHCELFQQLQPSAQLPSSENVSLAFKEYDERLIRVCASDNLLCDAFVNEFRLRKLQYDSAMLSTSANALMADHTFKVNFKTYGLVLAVLTTRS